MEKYPENNIVYNNQQISNRIPFITSIICTLFIFIYCLDYLFEFANILILITSLITTILLSPYIKLEENTKRIVVLAVSVIGTFAVSFEYNICRLDFGFGFFNSYTYSGSIGIMLGLFQIASVISLILILLSAFMSQLNKKTTIICLFISGILGLIFNIYEIIYLNPGASSRIYIWFGLAVLFWFLTQATYLISNKQ